MNLFSALPPASPDELDPRLDPALVVRVTKPLSQPGCVSLAIVRRILGWVDYFSRGLPLLGELEKAWGQRSREVEGELPVVYAEPQPNITVVLGGPSAPTGGRVERIETVKVVESAERSAPPGVVGQSDPIDFVPVAAPISAPAPVPVSTSVSASAPVPAPVSAPAPAPVSVPASVSASVPVSTSVAVAEPSPTQATGASNATNTVVVGAIREDGSSDRDQTTETLTPIIPAAKPSDTDPHVGATPSAFEGLAAAPGSSAASIKEGQAQERAITKAEPPPVPVVRPEREPASDRNAAQATEVAEDVVVVGDDRTPHGARITADLPVVSASMGSFLPPTELRGTPARWAGEESRDQFDKFVVPRPSARGATTKADPNRQPERPVNTTTQRRVQGILPALDGQAERSALVRPSKRAPAPRAALPQSAEVIDQPAPTPALTPVAIEQVSKESAPVEAAAIEVKRTIEREAGDRGEPAVVITHEIMGRPRMAGPQLTEIATRAPIQEDWPGAEPSSPHFKPERAASTARPAKLAVAREIVGDRRLSASSPSPLPSVAPEKLGAIGAPQAALGSSLSHVPARLHEEHGGRKPLIAASPLGAQLPPALSAPPAYSAPAQQRQSAPERAAPPPHPGAQPQSAQAPSPAERPKPPIDIDAIASKVQQRIMRDLTRERERHGGLR